MKINDLGIVGTVAPEEHRTIQCAQVVGLVKSNERYPEPRFLALPLCF
jgi:hypothetical protein